MLLCGVLENLQSAADDVDGGSVVFERFGDHQPNACGGANVSVTT